MAKKKKQKRTNWKAAAEYWHQYAEVVARQLKKEMEFNEWAIKHIEKLTCLIMKEE